MKKPYHYLKTGAIRYTGNTNTACGKPWTMSTLEYDPKTTCPECLEVLKWKFVPAARGNALTFNGAQ